MTDLDQAKQFLNVLDPNAEKFTFQTFGEGKAKNNLELIQTAHDSLDDLAEALLNLNAQGAGVFVTVNATDASGRRTKQNITRVRAIWQEDDESFKGEYPLAPSIVVQTSPSKYHRYWLVERFLLPVFDQLMARMVESFGCDKGAKDLARVLRVPGFMHHKKEPHLVELKEANGHRYSMNDLVRAFPPIRQHRSRAPISRPLLATGSRNGSSSQLTKWTNEKQRVRSALLCLPSEDRPSWFRYGAAIHDACGGSHEGFEIWDGWSRKTKNNNYDAAEQRRYWDTEFKKPKEVKTTIASIFSDATSQGWIDPSTDDELDDLNALPTIDYGLIPTGYFNDTLAEPYGALTIAYDPIVSSTMEGVRKRFEEYGHRPSPEHVRGLEQIAKTFERMALRTLHPGYFLDQSFYVSFLPAGMGKTTTIVEAVKALVSIKRFSHVGVAIILSRLEEIRKLADAMGLSPQQFAVIASEGKDENRLGLQGDKTKARVLFTTQKGLETRSQNGRKFADMKELFYLGKARQVRVWDEAILPSKTHTLSRYSVSGLLDELSKYGPKGVAQKLDDFCDRLRDVSDRALVEVPDIGISVDEAALLFDADNDRSTVAALCELGGRMVRVRRDNTGNTALDYEDILPPDLAPMLVLDASGQQRKTYALWYTGRRGLTFLRSPQKTFKGLIIHHWNKGSGKTAHMMGEWKAIAEGVAKTINDEIPTSEEVLVVHFKKATRIPNMAEEIGKLIQGNAGRVHFCNWGRETATNDYCHIKYVILAGVPQYPPPQYEAIVRSVKGARAEDDITEREYEATRLGEVAHRILQAANRGMIRKSEGDNCPSGCHLYVIFPTGKRVGIPRDLLRRIFHKATLVRWEPIEKLSGRVKELVSLIEALPNQHVTTAAALARRLGIPDARNVRKQFKHPDFLRAMKERAIVLYPIGKGKFRIHRTVAEPFPNAAEDTLEDAW